ncbi:MAG: radical SAM protein [FCB group bacterium]|nr:radical SAM protein [FCB group bacterium]
MARKIEMGKALMQNCILCPRQCEINRFEESKGICQTDYRARVSSYFPHFGEESCITGLRGSGTIFFTSCNLRCVFCQNWDISHSNRERPVSPEELAQMMIHLQELGCHNINLVTPSHVIVPILEALAVAIEMGLCIPIVYNTSAYDSRESLELMDGIVDIYMPDFKFWSRATSQRYAKAPDYGAVARRNLRIMHAQVGDLVLDEFGIARRGLLIRHLVMPNHEEETLQVLNYISREISLETVVNVMFQYRPEYKVNRVRFPEINRSLSVHERSNALKIAASAGLKRLA